MLSLCQTVAHAALLSDRQAPVTCWPLRLSPGIAEYCILWEDLAVTLIRMRIGVNNLFYLTR